MSGFLILLTAIENCEIQVQKGGTGGLETTYPEHLAGTWQLPMQFYSYTCS